VNISVTDGVVELSGVVRFDVERDARGTIRRLKGDIFFAKPRQNIPEAEKPTARQRQAYRKNIKKAQRARRRR